MRKHINNFNLFKTNEVFSGSLKYDVNLDSVQHYDNFSVYRYSFITKDDVKYKVMLSIYTNGNSRIDFHTESESNEDNSSIYFLINTHDVYRVMNTLKYIIDIHKEIKQITISSSEERMTFYEKMLDYMKIRHEYINDALIGYIE